MSGAELCEERVWQADSSKFDSERLYICVSRIISSSIALRMIVPAQPRSAGRYSSWNFSINRVAIVQFAVVPEVIKNHTSIPYASTDKCILVLIPLLGGSSPDFYSMYQRGLDVYISMADIDHLSIIIYAFCRGKFGTNSKTYPAQAECTAKRRRHLVLSNCTPLKGKRKIKFFGIVKNSKNEKLR